MPGMVHGAWCHIEIPAASVDAAKRFYGGLFGWKFTDVPEMKYVI
jgi:predicted enzyme related to lactoylglutathione lyase